MFSIYVDFKEAVNLNAYKTAKHTQRFLKKYFSLQILHGNNGLQQLFLFFGGEMIFQALCKSNVQHSSCQSNTGEKTEHRNTNHNTVT